MTRFTIRPNPGFDGRVGTASCNGLAERIEIDILRDLSTGNARPDSTCIETTSKRTAPATKRPLKLANIGCVRCHYLIHWRLVELCYPFRTVLGIC